MMCVMNYMKKLGDAKIICLLVDGLLVLRYIYVKAYVYMHRLISNTASHILGCVSHIRYVCCIYFLLHYFV